MQHNRRKHVNTTSVAVVSFEREFLANTSNVEEITSNESLQQVSLKSQQSIEPDDENIETCDNDDKTFILEFLDRKGIENQSNGGTCKPSCYICTHFRLMYAIGTSTFTIRKQIVSTPWTNSTSYVQMVSNK